MSFEAADGVELAGLLSSSCAESACRESRASEPRGIRKPALFVYGDRDEFCFDDVPGCVRTLADAVGRSRTLNS